MKKFLLIAALVAFAGIIINYTLGGFKTIEPSLVSVDEAVVYGRFYEGSYKSEALSELVDELRAEQVNSNNGILTIVNYHQEEYEKRGTIKQFVGIIWKERPASTRYDTLVIPAYNAAQFRLQVKPLVMPSPKKLNNLAEDFAITMESTLQGISIEQYKDNTLFINYPINSP